MVEWNGQESNEFYSFEGEYLNGNKWNGKGRKVDDYGDFSDFKYINGKKKNNYELPEQKGYLSL